jgi:hypothetical protein
MTQGSLINQNEGAPVFDYFEVEERPVVIDRRKDAGWIWSQGSWQEVEGLAEKSYSAGLSMTQDAFVSKFPYAALAFLEEPIAT